MAVCALFVAGFLPFSCLLAQTGAEENQAVQALAASSSAQLAPTVLGLAVSPAVIDEEAKAKDIIERKITVKNISQRLQTFYVMVADIEEGQERRYNQEPNSLDRRHSIANWTNIRRGANELEPGEEIELDLKIDVSTFALPGQYHASIVLAPGSNTVIARENMAKLNLPEILVNVRVYEVIVEKAQLLDFKAARGLFVRAPIDFSFELENRGNRPISPQGRVLIYDRRGKEVARLAIGGEIAIEPAGRERYEFSWPDVEGFGKLKARAELEYGNSERRDIQDTIYFWYLPLPFLALFGSGLFILVILLTVLLFKKSYHYTPHHFLHHSQPLPREDVIDLKKRQ